MEISQLLYDSGFDTYDSALAWKNYKPFLKYLCQSGDRHSLFEIGGGRSPLFSIEEIRDIGVEYTINDISERELARAPEGYYKVCFDIAGDVPEHEYGKYDLMFSKMVFEHIKDSRKAYGNIINLLKTGGICVNFHPVLYSLPIVMNKLMPETMSRTILSMFSKNRNDQGNPKFPAYYNLCYATEKNRREIQKVGFSDVVVLPFYGHNYFKKIPLLREVDGRISRYAQNKDMRRFSSYAYIIVVK